MITQRTILADNDITVTPSGHIELRFMILTEEDGVQIDRKWHRTAIEPGGDVEAQLAAVNAHLEQMGKAPLEAEILTKVQGHAAEAWTPDVLSAYDATVTAAVQAPAKPK